MDRLDETPQFARHTIRRPQPRARLRQHRRLCSRHRRGRPPHRGVHRPPTGDRRPQHGWLGGKGLVRAPRGPFADRLAHHHRQPAPRDLARPLCLQPQRPTDAARLPLARRPGAPPAETGSSATTAAATTSSSQRTTRPCRVPETSRYPVPHTWNSSSLVRPGTACSKRCRPTSPTSLRPRAARDPWPSRGHHPAQWPARISCRGRSRAPAVPRAADSTAAKRRCRRSRPAAPRSPIPTRYGAPRGSRAVRSRPGASHAARDRP